MLTLDEIERFAALTDEMLSFSSLGIRPGLRRLSRLLSLLGSPQREFRALHVLGTNGKGSTVATINSVCRQAGLKTATYTSPHLISLHERVSVSGKFLPIETWRSALERTRRTLEGDAVLSETRPTFFENLTAMALLMIRDAGVDIAIMEAGMGGRYDASMLCDAMATIITPIGMDHMEYLGDTLSAIAAEKFAAVRPGVPAFYAADDPALRGQFLEACRLAGAEAYCLSELAAPAAIRLSLGGTAFSYVDASMEQAEFFTPLIGLHQAYNAANAVTVFKVLRNRCELFARVGDEQIRAGLEATRWPGRAEVLPRRNGQTVILDGAHNEHGMRALVATLAELAKSGAADAVDSVVFAVMRDKELPPLLDLLATLRCPVYCTQVPMKRALPSRALESAVLSRGIKSGGAYDNPLEALRAAESAKSRTIVCCGSLFLVGGIKKALGLYV